MKTIKKALTIILALVLAAGFGCLSAFAADEETPKDEYGDNVYKATYTISVYSGKEGNFGGSTVKKYPAHYGETLSIDLDTGAVKINGADKEKLNFAINNGSEYYARGFKVSGHDNDETSGNEARTGIKYRVINTELCD